MAYHPYNFRSLQSPNSPEDDEYSRRMSGGTQQRKRSRTVFTGAQLEILEEAFEEGPFLSPSRQAALGRKLRLTELQVKIWFQNQRAKRRKMGDEIEDYKPLPREEREQQQVDSEDEHTVPSRNSTPQADSPLVKEPPSAFRSVNTALKNILDSPYQPLNPPAQPTHDFAVNPFVLPAFPQIPTMSQFPFCNPYGLLSSTLFPNLTIPNSFTLPQQMLNNSNPVFEADEQGALEKAKNTVITEQDGKTIVEL